MAPNFEAFSRSMLALRSKPQVSLQRRGTISLNKAAYVTLGSPAAVELLYDRGLRIIGLHPIEAKADTAYIVRPAGPNGPFVISAMAFIRYFDIDTSQTRRWHAYLDDGVLCVDTSGPTPGTDTRAPRTS